MFTTTARIGRRAVQIVLPAIAVVATLRSASETGRRRSPPREPRELAMAEIQVVVVPHARATVRVPALAGGQVPSRLSASDRPIGWEAMGEATQRALAFAGATEPPPSTDVALGP